MPQAQPVRVAPPSESAKTDTPFSADLFVDRVRTELSAFLKSRPGKASQTGVARSIGMSPTVVSQFLSRSYAGDVLHVAHVVDQWLMLQVKRADQLQEPIYVETKIAGWIHEGLEMAHELGDIAMVYGAAGLGKTRTAKQYKAEHGETTLIVTATPAIRSPHALVATIADEVKVTSRYRLDQTQRDVCARLRDTGRLLIVDEAERLTFRSLETLQAIHDETRIGLALLADEVLWHTLTAGRSRAEYERLLSRVGIRRPISPGVDQADVEKIAVQFLGHANEECIAYLTAKAQGVGGFRSVVKHCRIACRQARGAGRKTVEVVDLEAASQQLGDGAVMPA